MKKIKQIIVALALLVGVSASMVPAPALAVNVFDQCGGSADSKVCKASGTDNAGSMATTIINTLLFILGIIAVIMIIVGGLRYVLSGGDSAGVKSAKDTILYSVVGLVVAMLAYAIVNYVVGLF